MFDMIWKELVVKCCSVIQFLNGFFWIIIEQDPHGRCVIVVEMSLPDRPDKGTQKAQGDDQTGDY